MSALVIEFVFIFQCTPVSDAWDFARPNCKPANPSVIANTVCNIVADIWIMVFVIPRVMPLQMPRRQKVSLLVVVSLGVLVIAASMVRCLLVTKLADNDDPTCESLSLKSWFWVFGGESMSVVFLDIRRRSICGLFDEVTNGVKGTGLILLPGQR